MQHNKPSSVFLPFQDRHTIALLIVKVKRKNEAADKIDSLAHFLFCCAYPVIVIFALFEMAVLPKPSVITQR